MYRTIKTTETVVMYNIKKIQFTRAFYIGSSIYKAF